MNSLDDRDRLLALLLRRSLRHGDFTLASGAKSRFYIDVRKTSLDPEGASLIGRLLWQAHEDDLVAGRIDALGGLTLGADPIVVAGALEAFARGVRLDAFLVRKAHKEHGAGNLIEGNLAAGARALVVEDVCTSGESALLAVRAAREAGATVTRAWCVVDRAAGGREALAREGVALAAVVGIEELLAATPTPGA
ncbi:MAG: orotate phosphoribosyltransferase [Candidatus Eisenbacteria bacterium]